MTYEILKRFAQFLQAKYPVGGAITIAERPDFEDEYLTIDWEIRPADVEEFARLNKGLWTTAVESGDYPRQPDPLEPPR